jgi:beta-glucosidase
MTDFAPKKGMTEGEIAETVEAILAEATLAEKVGMMSGKGFFSAYKEDAGVWGARPYRAGGGIERLNVPAFYFTDGPRGVARGQSTCFPCTMARGASFDTDLERRIGEAMSIEIKAQGCNLTGAVCVNLLRHPSWGRAQETYGEDTFHLGAMGSALSIGLQTHNVCATVKHYALNSMENARFKVDVRIDERTLHEIYLPHFRMILDAGVGSVMSAYNKMNGEYCGQHRELLTDILRGEWGFGGFVHSDWVMGVYKPYGAAAGLDVENPEPIVFGDKLIAAVDGGHIEPHVIDTACRRILTTLYRFECAENPLPDYPLSLVASPAHTALALEAAEKSAVLLTNDGTLPLDAAKLQKLAVVGKLADMVNTGDNGSSRVRAPYVVTPLEGLKRYLGADRITADIGAADAVVVVAGYTAEEEGEFIPGDLALGQAGSEAAIPDALKEARKKSAPRPKSIGGDRIDLGLPADQIAEIESAAKSGKPVIVVLVTGSALMVEGWHDKVSAILQTFYCGMEGGTALARLLFGDVSPSGRLPFTVARDPAQYPHFDRDAETIDYDYWHGYAKFEAQQLRPRFAFGHGLSYTDFGYRALQARLTDDAVEVSVAVSNTGGRSGGHAVLAYVAYPGSVQPRARRSLQAFDRVELAAGETRVVRMRIPLDQLAYRCPDTHGWKLESGEHRIEVGDLSVGFAL